MSVIEYALLKKLGLGTANTSWDLKHRIPCQQLCICANAEDCRSESRSKHCAIDRKAEESYEHVNVKRFMLDTELMRCSRVLLKLMR